MVDVVIPVGRSRTHRWRGALVAGLLALGGLLPQAVPAGGHPLVDPTPVDTTAVISTSLESTCVLAQSLSDSGLPQQALATIDQLGDAAAGVSECEQARLGAAGRIAQARLLVSQAARDGSDEAADLPTALPSVCQAPGAPSSSSTGTGTPEELLDWSRQCDAEVAIPAADPTATEGSDIVCKAAEDLVTAGRPQQALELIETLGDKPPADCAEAAASARVRVARASFLASLATGRLDGSTDHLPAPATSPQVTTPSDAVCGAVAADASVGELADGALDCDADNAVAKDLAAGSGDDRWDAFVSDYLEPLVPRALVFLGIVAGLLVIARIGTMLLPPRGLPVAEGQQPIAVAASAVLIGAAAWAGTGGWGMLGADPTWPWRYLAAGVFGLLGAALLAWVWSRRMRLGIRVVDEKDDLQHASTGHLAGLIHDLGGSTLHGLETPRGSDATAVDASGLTTTPEGRIVAALYRLLQLLVPLNPWAIRVEVSSADRLTLSIRRNGRSIANEVIDRDQLHLRIPIDRLGSDGTTTTDGKSATPQQPDLLRMAAAAVLFQLNEEYGFGGLGGAHTWQSVGWQYVSTTDLAEADAEATALLARALDYDPKNLVVEYLLWHRRYRDATVADDIARYAEWLDAFVNNPPSKDVGLALLLRAQYTRAVMWVNHAYASRSAPTTSPEDAGLAVMLQALYARAVMWVSYTYADRSAITSARQVTVEKGAALDLHLLDALKACRSGSEAERNFADRMEAPVNLLRLSLYPSVDDRPNHAQEDWTEPDPEATEKAVRSPHEAYQAACYYGSRTPLTDTAHAVNLLRRAEADPRLKEWFAKDPQLASLRAQDEYREAFGRTPRTDLLELPDFAPYSAALTKIGATDPEVLSGPGQTAHDLSTRLGVTRSAAQHLIALAALARSTTWPATVDKKWHVELAGALSSLGISDLAAQRRPGLAARVRTALDHDKDPFTSEPPSVADLATVLD